MKSIVALLAILAASACSTFQPAPTQEVEAPPIERSLAAGVVLFSASGHLVCAAQRVDPKHILTAYHCAVASGLSEEALDKLLSSGADITSVPPERIMGAPVVYTTYAQFLVADGSHDIEGQFGHYVKLDRRHDLALFETKADYSQPTVSVDASGLKVGQDIYAIGHPSGMAFTYSKGVVATPCRKYSGDLDGFDADQCWTQVDMTIHGGSSGGGLYNMSGSLVGVASWMMAESQGFYVGPEYIRDFLTGV